VAPYSAVSRQQRHTSWNSPLCAVPFQNTVTQKDEDNTATCRGNAATRSKSRQRCLLKDRSFTAAFYYYPRYNSDSDRRPYAHQVRQQPLTTLLMLRAAIIRRRSEGGRKPGDATPTRPDELAIRHRSLDAKRTASYARRGPDDQDCFPDCFRSVNNFHPSSRNSPTPNCDAAMRTINEARCTRHYLCHALYAYLATPSDKYKSLRQRKQKILATSPVDLPSIYAT